jgi:hypothetical protein
MLADRAESRLPLIVTVLVSITGANGNMQPPVLLTAHN